jgi:YacP-like NYN domain
MTSSAPIVLVDARNVQRSRWPNISDAEVVERACAWATERGLHLVAVFDGPAPGGLVGERADGPCAVVGTGRESADEWLKRKASALAERGERFWLVTSDRALRAVAGARAERTIGGGSFANELLSITL